MSSTNVDEDETKLKALEQNETALQTSINIIYTCKIGLQNNLNLPQTIEKAEQKLSSGTADQDVIKALKSILCSTDIVALRKSLEEISAKKKSIQLRLKTLSESATHSH
eukprot:398406_1